MTMERNVGRAAPPVEEGVVRPSGEREDGGMMQKARQKGSELAGKVEEKAGELQHQARERGEELKERAEESIDEQKSMVAERIDAVARALRAASGSLREQDEPQLGRMGDELADSIERMTSYLRRNDTRGLISDLEDQGRSNPGMFLGSTFAAGLLLGRFLRASPPEREEVERDAARVGSTRSEEAVRDDVIVPDVREPGRLS